MTSDITPTERKILEGMRYSPHIYIGRKSLTLLDMWARGYETALITAGVGSERFLLSRDELDAFAAKIYKSRKSFGFTAIITRREPDEELAFDLFFEMLDVVLKNSGYEPIT